MRNLFCLAGAFALALSAAVVFADTLKLNDGTTLAGKVLPQGEQYWIKLADGSTKLVKNSDVATWTKGDAPAAPGTPAAGAPAAGGTPAGGTVAGSGAARAGGDAPDFIIVKSRAERCDAPLAAVAMWQAYLDAHPAAPDLADARKELARWKDLDAQHAERINGKWVGGDERKKLIAKVGTLMREAAEAMTSNQTLKAVGKLQEAVKLYPNNFPANFELGYFYLVKGTNADYDKAITSLETAARLQPNSAAAWSNLAIAYNFRKQYEKSVLTAFKAAQLDDGKEIVQNLVNAITYAPPGMRQNNSKVRGIMDESGVLAGKHGITPEQRTAWAYVRPKPGDDDKDPVAGDEDKRPGVIGNGSGFIVSADGYVLTNRHVAAEKDCTFLCRFVDGTEKTAEVVVIDEELDVALLKLKGVKPFPFLKLAADDDPRIGAACTALGYPIADLMNYNMQTTVGNVSSLSPNEPYHVTLTAKITHGNSGGPLLDKNGFVIGIVSAGLTAYNETYGKALSAGQVRAFLKRHADKYAAKFDPGKAGEAALDAEALYKQASPATLCIILVRTTPAK